MELLFALVALQAALQAPGPTPVARGTDSAIAEPREVVVRTDDEWRMLWNEHAPGGEAPDVDFSRSVVVGVFLGFRPTAGYEVTITNVRTKDGAAIVQFEERRPPPGALVAQVVTAPFHLVSLPREVSAVEFERLESAAR